MVSSSAALLMQIVKFNSTAVGIMFFSNVAMYSAFRSALLSLKPREVTPLLSKSSALALASPAFFTSMFWRTSHSLFAFVLRT